MPECDCHTAVFATGNNIGFKGDMVRRGLVCAFEALDERPEMREFKTEALELAAVNRGAYVAAALTVIRAYLAAGEPRVCAPFGSYAHWSRMVRGPLVWLGEPDPIRSIEKSRTEDEELSDIRELFELWIDYDLGLDTPYLTASLIESVCAQQAPNDFNAPVFRDFLLRVAGDKNGKVSAKRLGEWFRQISGRMVTVINASKPGRYRLVRTQGSSNRAAFHLSKVD
jgi:hypothetical protein